MLLATLLGAAPLGAAAPSRDPATEERVQALYAEGSTHFNLAEYEQAIEAFKQGYALSAASGFLYNIAQAYRLKGDCAQALLFYGNYLRAKPNADNRPAVEERIQEMQRCAEPSTAPAASGADPTVRPAAAATAAPDSGAGAVGSDPSGQGARGTGDRGEKPSAADGSTDAAPNARLWAGVVIGAVGLAAVGVGIYFGVESAAAADEVTKLSETHGAWTSDFQDTEARGELFERLAIACWTIGGSSIVLGAVLTYLGLDSQGVSVALDGSPEGGGLRMRWAF